jgi:large subunit ribosomal protein L25
VHDLQLDPVKDTPTHVDFYIVDMRKELEVKVPLEFTGLAEAEKGGLGNLVKVLHEVEVKALPDKIPHAIVVDVTGLATLEDKIHVSDLHVPTGVTIITPGEEVVALVSAFVEEKEEAPIDLESIEVVEKGKKEEAPSEESA